jgi:hypothetical protein
MRKKKKKKTIGKMANSRMTWHIKPVTKVKDDDTKYNRNKDKQYLRKMGEF